MVLAGGTGERLRPLTYRRCKPAVPFGGNFRVIDFTLINCACSNLRQIYVLTQYQSATWAEVVHVFLPFSFQPLSTLSALSCIDAASEPACGSL